MSPLTQQWNTSLPDRSSHDVFLHNSGLLLLPSNFSGINVLPHTEIGCSPPLTPTSPIDHWLSGVQ